MPAANRCLSGSHCSAIPGGGGASRLAPHHEHEEGELRGHQGMRRRCWTALEWRESAGDHQEAAEAWRGFQGPQVQPHGCPDPSGLWRREPSFRTPCQDWNPEVRDSRGQSSSSPPAKGPKTTVSGSLDGMTPGKGLPLPTLGLLICVMGDMSDTTSQGVMGPPFIRIRGHRQSLPYDLHYTLNAWHRTDAP